MVRGPVVHEDEFPLIAVQVFAEHPVHFFLEFRNGLFFIQAGNNQGNALHTNAHSIRLAPCGFQKISVLDAQQPFPRRKGKAAGNRSTGKKTGF